MICHFQSGGVAPAGRRGGAQAGGRGRAVAVGRVVGRPEGQRGAVRQGAQAFSTGSQAGSTGALTGAPPGASDPSPLAPVLARLIGREVTILAGGTLYTGRLIQSSPVTLTDAGGQVTIIAAPVISVAF